MASKHEGCTFGKLLVTGSRMQLTAGGNPRQILQVRCLCGVEYETSASNILGPKGAKQCIACRALEHKVASSRGFGHELHSVWQAMVNRCHDVNNNQYRNYGGRGIEVCSRWRGARPNGEMSTIDGFHAFCSDMGPRPDGLTLDREDNDRGYTPGNCRWATWEQQGNNRRGNVRVTLNGETRTIAQWGRIFGMGDCWASIARSYGVPLEDALQHLASGEFDGSHWQKLFGIARVAHPTRERLVPAVPRKAGRSQKERDDEFRAWAEATFGKQVLL